MIKNHWKMEAQFLGSKLADKRFRKHLLWYTKELEGASRFRQLAGKLKDEEAILNELNEYFCSVREQQVKIMP